MRPTGWSRAGLFAGLIVFAVGAPVAAQSEPAPDRGLVSINGGYQARAVDVSDSVAMLLHAENGRIDSRYEVNAGPTFDAGGGVFLGRRRLAIGAAVTRYNRTRSAEVTGNLPHPFFFSRPRVISGTAADLTREETAVHIQVMWVTAVNPALTIAFFGGPSVFRVTQDLVEEVFFSESYPFDTARFTGVRKERQRDVTAGFNAGVDVGFFFSRYVGIGGLFRFSRATATLDTGDADSLSLTVGGAEGSGGLRLRF